MPRKPHSAIVDRLRRDLSSLVLKSTSKEIRERCAATAQPDVQPLQNTNPPYPQGLRLRRKQ